jgi:hypothetical protein
MSEGHTSAQRILRDVPLHRVDTSQLYDDRAVMFTGNVESCPPGMCNGLKTCADKDCEGMGCDDEPLSFAELALAVFVVTVWASAAAWIGWLVWRFA